MQIVRGLIKRRISKFQDGLLDFSNFFLHVDPIVAIDIDDEKV